MFNLKTPGREDKEDEIVTEEANSNTEEGLTQLATNYIAAVGGTDNLKAIDALKKASINWRPTILLRLAALTT